MYTNPMAYKDKEKERAWFAKRYRDNQEFLQQYKVEHGCADCGYNEHHAALEFDHIDPSNKSSTVSRLAGRSRAALMKELVKCEVVCSNCHSVRTWSRHQETFVSKWD